MSNCQGLQLFKYRPLLGNKNRKHLSDIIKNRRMFCCPFLQLNDPMEGAFQYTPWPERENEIAKSIDTIVNNKTKHRILSLAKDWDSMLMWAHYASGMRGVCVEICVPYEAKVFPVAYTQYVADFFSDPNQEEESTTAEQEKQAELLLLRKGHLWSYEREYRILHENEYVEVTITRVLLGARIDTNDKKYIGDLCRDQNIPVVETKVDWSCQTIREKLKTSNVATQR